VVLSHSCCKDCPAAELVYELRLCLPNDELLWMLAVVFVVLAGGLFIAAYKAEKKA
jgi:hypothetical protein